MLKITEISKDETVVLIHLEGRIIGGWADELLRECLTILRRHHQIILDLGNVNFVDEKGIEILKEIKSREIRFINCSLFLSELLKEVIIS